MFQQEVLTHTSRDDVTSSSCSVFHLAYESKETGVVAIDWVPVSLR